MPLDHEKFSNLLSGIQSAVVAIAVIVGGIWTLYRFVALDEVNKAKADLLEVQDKLKKEATLDVSIQPSQIAIPGERGHFIQAIVTVQNKGSRNASMSYGENVFTATPVRFANTGAPSFGTSVAGKAYDTPPFIPDPVINSVLVQVGQSLKTSFLVRVNNAGLYLVAFRSDVSSEELANIRGPKSSEKGTTTAWSDSVFFVVK